MLQKIKELFSTIMDNTIYCLEIEDSYHRWWETGLRTVLEKRLDNLFEDEYFSDWDTCCKQTHPLCQEFYGYVNDTTRNTHFIFDERQIFPFWLEEKGIISMEKVKELDIQTLKEIEKQISNKYFLTNVKNGYEFTVKNENTTIVVFLPFYIDLTKSLNEKVYIRINYNFSKDNYGSIPYYVPYDEVLEFMRNGLTSNYMFELVKKLTA